MWDTADPLSHGRLNSEGGAFLPLHSPCPDMRHAIFMTGAEEGTGGMARAALREEEEDKLALPLPPLVSRCTYVELLDTEFHVFFFYPRGGAEE